jgi:hypothetical protein
MIDLIAAAPGAVWSSGAGRLSFGGSRDNPSGFAIYPKPGLVLEDGSWLERPILEMHPRWADDGWICGEFSLNSIAPGEALVARLGFIAPDGPPRTTGVIVTILCEGNVLYEAPKRYTHRFVDLTLDLTPFIGNDRLLSISVAADGDSTQAWLVWTTLCVCDASVAQDGAGDRAVPPATNRRRF